MRLSVCISALCLLNFSSVPVAADEGSCGWAGGFPMTEAEQTYLALEAASRRPDYECHCSGLDPSAYITTKFKKLTGKQLTPNRVWKSKNQPPGEPSNPDCASKTAFNIAGIYGSVDKAQVCFKAAVEQIKSKWDKVYIGQYLSASAGPALSTDSLKLYAFIVYGPTLRMAFHDCGTWQRYPKPAFDKNPQCGGCNGSFKKEYEDGKSTNFCTFPQQNASSFCLHPSTAVCKQLMICCGGHLVWPTP
eukprot:2871-Heterococcus_DN1.PRE.1